MSKTRKQNLKLERKLAEIIAAFATPGHFHACAICQSDVWNDVTGEDTSYHEFGDDTW